MKRIPVGPLRAFDVAARNLNLSAAAEEMNVTHAAVSRQVKQLEERLGVKLFERLPRGLKLTAHGALLAEGTREAFDRLACAIEDVSMPAVRRKLTISTFASLSARWLMPRVGLSRAVSGCGPPGRHTTRLSISPATTSTSASVSARQLSRAPRDAAVQAKEIVVAAPSLLKRGPPLKTFARSEALHTAAQRFASRLDPLARRRRRQGCESSARHHLR